MLGEWVNKRGKQQLLSIVQKPIIAQRLSVNCHLTQSTPCSSGVIKIISETGCFYGQENFVQQQI